ncbi:MAG: hypothetical protein LBO02_02375 [Holosporaceae bacterium]|nr:hypothetical protein [Holosporaceae bacterium]
MKKTLNGGIIIAGAFMLICSSYAHAKLPLLSKIGQSSAMQSDVGAAFGTNAKEKINQTAAQLRKQKALLQDSLKSADQLNHRYPIIDPRRIKDATTSLRNFDALVKCVELIRDAKRKELVKAKVSADFVAGIYGLFNEISDASKNIDAEKLTDKEFFNVKRNKQKAEEGVARAEKSLQSAKDAKKPSDRAIASAEKNLDLAKRALDQADLNLKRASKDTTASIRDDIAAIRERLANKMELIIIPQAQTSDKNETIGKVLEIFGVLETLNEKTQKFLDSLSTHNNARNESSDENESSERESFSAEESDENDTNLGRGENRLRRSYRTDLGRYSGKTAEISRLNRISWNNINEADFDGIISDLSKDGLWYLTDLIKKLPDTISDGKKLDWIIKINAAIKKLDDEEGDEDVRE